MLLPAAGYRVQGLIHEDGCQEPVCWQSAGLIIAQAWNLSAAACTMTLMAWAARIRGESRAGCLLDLHDKFGHSLRGVVHRPPAENACQVWPSLRGKSCRTCMTSTAKV